MKKSSGVVHAIATCVDCGWISSNYKNAQAVGAKHAKHYGHLVEVEVGIVSVYDGRSAVSQQPEEEEDA